MTVNRACTKPRTLVWISVLGTFCCVLGILFAFVWPPVFKAVLKQQLKLENGTQVYDLWSESPIPIYLEMYFFNVTNPVAVQNGREKPKLVETGPYFYREKRKKVNVVYNDDDTVDFEMQRFWFFEPEKSVGSEEDQIMALNVVAATAASIAMEKGNFFQWAINSFFILKEIPLFHTKTVRELMFAGYEDPIINFAEDLPFQIFEIPFDKFGWFYPRNGSEFFDGLFTMGLGQRDLSTFGQMIRWNGSDETPYYPSYCGRVNGSAGELFPPFLRPDKLPLFITDICRTINLSFNKVTWNLGMKSYQFWADELMLADPKLNPDNWCFCANGTQSRCSPSGTVEISKCRYGAPAYISYPHFYLADERLSQAVDGMKPNPEKHKMTLTVEPTTGLPMEVNAALQINIKMVSSKLIHLYQHVNETIVPMVWFRQSAEMTESIAKDVRFPVLANMILPPAGYCLLGLGLVVLFACAARHVAGPGVGTGLLKRGESTVDLLNDENAVANGDPPGGRRDVGPSTPALRIPS